MLKRLALTISLACTLACAHAQQPPPQPCPYEAGDRVRFRDAKYSAYLLGTAVRCEGDRVVSVWDYDPLGSEHTNAASKVAAVEPALK